MLKGMCAPGNCMKLQTVTDLLEYEKHITHVQWTKFKMKILGFTVLYLTYSKLFFSLFYSFFEITPL